MRKLFPGFLALSLVALSACGNDTTAPPPPSHDDGTIQGEIGDSDFQFEIRAGGPGDLLRGPFLLQGTNLHYDDNAHQLIVDLTVKNLGGYAHPEPIGLTFIRLDPDGVTVANPDNDIHDDGAAIVFQFANDDGMWTPDEQSLPRTVQFDVPRGVSIGFVARLDISAPAGGTIDGVVWNDGNQNGVRDDDEPGVPGIDVYWGDFAQEGDSTGTHEFGRVTTGPDGHYVIGPLHAGGWVVSIAPSTVAFMPTTPTEIHVILVEVDGDVSDYHGANFGGIPAVMPPPPGERIHASGVFLPPAAFAAGSIEHFVCPSDSVPGALVIDPSCYGGRLRGPVTEIAPLRNALRVMATWVLIDATMLPLDLEVGDRVDVHVDQGPGPAGWLVDFIAPWKESHDEIEGRVEAVEIDRDGRPRWLVMGTWIRQANIEVGKR